jgi:ribA/ribD-fused uncharacterized protein
MGSNVIPFLSHKPATAAKQTGNAAYYCFSNWSPIGFTDPARGEKFISMEQFMMASKAQLFGDMVRRRQIMDIGKDFVYDETKEAEWFGLQAQIKELGRQIKPFDPFKWNEYARQIVELGLYIKFDQHPEHKKTLMETGDALLCEASSKDPIWGIGMDIYDYRVKTPEEWRGKNWLGQCLMNTRQEFKREEERQGLY